MSLSHDPLRSRLRNALIATAALALGGTALDAGAAPPAKPGAAFVAAGPGGGVYGNGLGSHITTLQLPRGEYLLQVKFWYLATTPGNHFLFCRFEQNGVTLPDIMTVIPDQSHRMAVMAGAFENTSNIDLAVHVFCTGTPQVEVQHVRFIATPAEVEVQLVPAGGTPL